MRKARLFFARTVQAGRILARDERVPRWLRWLVVLGLLPIPGPVDELVLLLAAPLLFLFARGPMRDAWRALRDPPAGLGRFAP